ncbi:hypothetical protein EDB83DRAFT_331660 [Lactarius deliciosus]|nr:hypothetical protein EDB83DRAFT_331660 [Lactarius deliciosus]
MAQASLWLTVPCYLRIHVFPCLLHPGVRPNSSKERRRQWSSPNPPPSTDVRSITVMVLSFLQHVVIPSLSDSPSSATTFGAHSLKCIPLQNARHCVGLASTTWNKHSAKSETSSSSCSRIFLPTPVVSCRGPWTVVVSKRQKWIRQGLEPAASAGIIRAGLRLHQGQRHPGSITSARSGTTPDASGLLFQNNNPHSLSIDCNRLTCS